MGNGLAKAFTTGRPHEGAERGEMKSQDRWARDKMRELIAAIVKMLDEDALAASNKAVVCWRAATALKRWR